MPLLERSFTYKQINPIMNDLMAARTIKLPCLIGHKLGRIARQFKDEVELYNESVQKIFSDLGTKVPQANGQSQLTIPPEKQEESDAAFKALSEQTFVIIYDPITKADLGEQQKREEKDPSTALDFYVYDLMEFFELPEPVEQAT